MMYNQDEIAVSVPDISKYMYEIIVPSTRRDVRTCAKKRGGMALIV